MSVLRWLLKQLAKYLMCLHKGYYTQHRDSNQY